MSEYSTPHDERMKRKKEFRELTYQIRKMLGINYKKQYEEVGSRHMAHESTYRNMRSMNADKYYPTYELIEDLRRTYGKRLEEKGLQVKRKIITPEQADIHELKKRVKKLEEEMELINVPEQLKKMEGILQVALRYLEETKKEKSETK